MTTGGFVLQITWTFLWSLEIVIQMNLDHDIITVSNLTQSWSISAFLTCSTVSEHSTFFFFFLTEMRNIVKISNSQMVKLDTFCLKTQLKYSDKTLVKKLSQELKLSFKKKAYVFHFFFHFKVSGLPIEVWKICANQVSKEV